MKMVHGDSKIQNLQFPYAPVNSSILSYILVSFKFRLIWLKLPVSYWSHMYVCGMYIWTP